jgi:hypothetical protein
MRWSLALVAIFCLAGVSDALAHLRCQVDVRTVAAKDNSSSPIPGRPIPPVFAIPRHTQVYIYEPLKPLEDIPSWMQLRNEDVRYVRGARDPYVEGFLWILLTHTRRGRTVRHIDLDSCDPWP